MNTLRKTAAVSAAVLSACLFAVQTAQADEVSGTVLAYDRVAGVLVLTDKTSYPLETATMDIPVSLSAGDRVTIEFEGDEDGISAINAITILAEGDNT